jgi:ATP-dependent Clp protease ATP-binding subunit ClpC
MFERYTEKARRAIFFARYEASQFGSSYIEPEHILLGILREDKTLANRLIGSHSGIESIRGQIERQIPVRERVSTSVDLPLSQAAKRAMAYAAEESERLRAEYISTGHLFLGLLREEKSFVAQILNDKGLRLSTARDEIAKLPIGGSGVQTAGEPSLVSMLGKDLTLAATSGQLKPLVVREREADLVIETLCRRFKNNPVLAGEAALARCVVETVALKITDGAVPASLQDKRIISCDPSMLKSESSNGAKYKELARELSQQAANVIVFVDEMDELLNPVSGYERYGAPTALSSLLSDGSVRWIGTTRHPYKSLNERYKRLADRVQEIPLAQLNEGEFRTILGPTGRELESFHDVIFDEGAIANAMAHGEAAPAGESVLIRAADVLDRAAAHVRIQRETVPQRARDLQRQLRLVMQDFENAIGSHEFEKARPLSEEEQRLREALRQSLERHELSDRLRVTQADVEAVLGLWGGSIPTQERPGPL